MKQRNGVTSDVHGHWQSLTITVGKKKANLTAEGSGYYYVNQALI
jgi:hypothetical protein